MILQWPTFVLQRRINVAPVCVLRSALDRSSFGGGTLPVAGADGSLRCDEPFHMIDHGRHPTWRARARLLDSRGKCVARVELEIGPWSPSDTELLLRPRAAHPERWSGRRARRYFVNAHRRADDLVVLFTRRRGQ